MKSTLSPAQPNEAFIVIQTVAYNANYKVTINGVPVTHTTTLNCFRCYFDSGTIAAALAIAGLLNAQPNITATQIGPGVYVSSTHHLLFLQKVLLRKKVSMFFKKRLM